MSNLAFLTNLASSTRLKEGSLEALVARVAKVTEGMTDIEKGKVETAILDAFTSVSSTLDRIELDRATQVVNRLQGGARRSGYRAPTGFLLPDGDD